MSSTYHNTCTRATAKVQFSVDVPQVISHWAYGAVEGDYNVVLIQQLKRKFSFRSAARPGGTMRWLRRTTYHEVVVRVVTGLPAVLVAVRSVKYSAILLTAKR